LAAPPARWIPIVSAWWASGDSAPTLIADTTNRRAIERALSTSASGAGMAAATTRRSSRTSAGGRAPTFERWAAIAASAASAVASATAWIVCTIRGA
jgi:hypothetical protein